MAAVRSGWLTHCTAPRKQQRRTTPGMMTAENRTSALQTWKSDGNISLTHSFSYIHSHFCIRTVHTYIHFHTCGFRLNFLFFFPFTKWASRRTSLVEVALHYSHKGIYWNHFLSVCADRKCMYVCMYVCVSSSVKTITTNVSSLRYLTTTKIRAELPCPKRIEYQRWYAHTYILTPISTHLRITYPNLTFPIYTQRTIRFSLWV